MSWVSDLQGWADNEFAKRFNEREGRIVPSTEDVTSDQLVKLGATFLYADLAGSSELARHCPVGTTGHIIRAFLECSTRLMRAYKGEVRSFDGDRVMAIFIGDNDASKAVKCAREIFYTVEYIIGPTARAKFDSVRNADIKLKCGLGVDKGDARAARAGMRNNNDLIWLGRAPSLAAKLSDVRDYPRSVYISSATYHHLPATERLQNGASIWTKKPMTFAGSNEIVYCTNYPLKP